MANWQADFHVIPKRALAVAPQSLSVEMLNEREWWQANELPRDYQSRLTSFVSPAQPWSPDSQAWGTEEGNRIEIFSSAGRVVNVRARVDVRRPDAKFAAGLILFVRAADASLVRIDGVVTDLTAGGFSQAMRGSPAWSTRATS